VSAAARSPLRLDFLSPLPPARTGIADYALDLLPHLAARCDVRVVRLPDQPVAPEVEERWRPAPFASLGADGRLPLYQMGNNWLHDAVREAALRLPGVMALHDVVLHHHLLDGTVGRGRWQPYRDALAADHGWIGAAAALPARDGYISQASQFALPAHRALVRRQRGVLVHSRWAAELIAEEHEGVAARAVPMGIPLPPPANHEMEAMGRAFRARHGLPADRPLLGSLGFQTPIKRSEEVIRALARPGLEGVHLLIAGEVAPMLDLEGAARRAGVADRVVVTGFLPATDFAAAVAACDLHLNLRYPSAGETSAALLRVLAAGRPAVVSDYAQFAELPDSAVLRIPVGEGEGEALAAALLTLLAQPERLRAMGAAAREYVARAHDPATAAAAVADACAELAEREPPGEAPCVAESMTSLTLPRLGGRIEVAGAERPWPAGERRRLRVRLENGSAGRWLRWSEGPGGMAVRSRVVDASGVDAVPPPPWRALPRDLEPGGVYEFEIELRRPLGAARLRIEPVVAERGAAAELGGPVWDSAI
jgi:glycosyltransferase involved in cell wall biosynthesis